MTELLNTRGVYLCLGCAAWAVARLTRVANGYLSGVRLLPRIGRWHRAAHRQIGHLQIGHRHAEHRHGAALQSATPILFSADVDRTSAYYAQLGFELVERYDDGYLLMRAGDSEVHFTTATVSSAPGDMFVHVADATAYWKQRMAQGVAGIGPVEDKPWGVREFVATDPDGNRIRLGSTIPAHPS